MGCLVSKNIKILVLLGSARKSSANAGVVRQICQFPINLKHKLQLIVLTLDKIPIFSEDEQKNVPLCQGILNLRKHAEEAKAIIFVTPQINGSISPLLLNAFVWLSRQYDKKKGSPLLNKKAAVVSASYLSQNQMIDCQQMGQYFGLKFFSEKFHLTLGKKVANQEGKIVSSAEVGRLLK